MNLAKIRYKGSCGGSITQKTSVVNCPKYYTSAPVRDDGLYINTCPDGHQYVSSLNFIGHRCYYVLSSSTYYSCNTCGTTYPAAGTCTKETERDFLQAN